MQTGVCRAALLALLPTVAAVPVQAQDKHWDANGSGPGSGGDGTWETTGSEWSTNSDGTTGPYSVWDNGALDNAIFGGTAGTVTLTEPITVGDVTFNVPGYILTGSTLTFQGADPTITLTGAGGNTSINSVIAGTDGLRIDGSGSTNRQLTFNRANTFTGGLTIDSGRLVAAASNALNGANNVVTINSGAALQINNANAFGGNTAAANLVMNDGANLWFGNQNLTHDITATGGTIVIADVFANGNSTWTGNLNLTADTTVLVSNTGANDNLLFAGNLTDTGANRLSLVLNEGGELNSSLFLTGTNSFTGGITVNSGQLFATGADSLGGTVGNVVTINGGFLRASGNAFGGDTDAAQLILNGGVLRVEQNHTLNHDVTLTGATAFIDGIGNATWNGTTVLTASTLLRLGIGGHTLTMGGTLADTGANVLSVTTQGGTVRFNGDLSFSGDLTLESGNTWFDGGAYTYGGDTIISTNARLLLNGGTVSPNSNIRFEGLNNGSHTTIIYGTNAQPSITMANGANGGELRWNGTGGFYALDAASGGADVTVNLGGAGATLTWNDGLFVPDDHALILGTNATNGNARQVDFQNGIDLNGALRTVRVDNGNINDHALISGVLSGTGGLQVIGNGALELTETNTYSGATVIGDTATNSDGALILGSAGALPASSNLQFNGFTDVDGVTNAGLLMLTANSGDFTDSVGTGANQVQWTASGGFGAIGGERTVNLGGAGATLTWGTGGFVGDSDVLRFGGRFSNSAINWENGIDLGVSDRTINANEGVGSGFGDIGDLEVNLNGVIEGDGGLVLVGAGDVALNALNTYAGATWIGGSNVGGTDNQMVVWANTLADTGAASSLGAGATVVMASHSGGLIYTGGTTSTNRTLALNETNGGIHHLFNRGSGAIDWTGNVTMTGSGVNTLRLGGTFVSSDLDGDGVADDPNIIAGVISDGSGVTQVQGASNNCAAGDVWRLTGANTFTGQFNPLGCTFEVTTLGNAGDASSVGSSDLVADYRSGNGIVRYIGTGETSDRSFWAWSDSHLESSGTGALVLSSTEIVVSQNGGFTHWLGGTNTDDNILAATLVDSPTPTEFSNSWFRLGKEGPGLWALTTDNNAQPNAFSSMVRIFGGALRLDNAGAITGGLGVTSSHGATGSDQRSALIRFEGANDGTAGVLGLTAASGGFFRGLTTAADGFVNNNGTTIGVDPDGPTGPLPAYGIEALDDDNYVQGVRWFGSGGFAAWDGTQVVNMFGDGREVTWGAGGFVPTNQQLVFGYVTADGTVDFQNAVNLGGAARTVHVNDGLANRDAIISGAMRGTTVLGGLTKTGEGTLTLTGANIYAGITTVSAGTLEVGAGGTAGTLGSGTQAVVANGATLAINRSDAFTLDKNVIGGGTLLQSGAGTTTMTVNSDIGHVVLDQGTLVTPGSLVTEDVTFTDDGGATLQVKGTLQTAAAGAVLVTGGLAGDTIIVDAGATMLANGGLGEGGDALDVAGTLDMAGGVFDLAAGNDTFSIRDDTNILGIVDGGADTDTLNANIASSADLTQVLNFETLAKTGVGVLNVNGPGISDFGAVNVNAGTLNVVVGAEIAAATGGTLNTVIASGATLTVDGAFGCGTGADTTTIAGNVTGTGTIDQCGGDDLLTLQDGSSVSGYTGTFDGGADTDTVELDIATALDFAQGTVTNYENLLKSNTGTATLSGAHTYTGGTTITGGMLDVDGSLTTPTVAMTNLAGTSTLNVDGLAQAAGATQIVVSGSTAANAVDVAAGGTLLASGDLGDGADVLDVAGLLNTGAGSFALGAGGDTFVIHDDTAVLGTVDGGADIDILNANIATAADLGAVLNFETLTKSGTGVLNVNGPGTSDFSTVNVNAGTLNVVAGSQIAPAAGGTLDTLVATGATLNVDGSYGCGAGNDTMTLAGNVTGSGDISLCAGDDTLTLFDSADSSTLTTAIDGGADTDIVVADIAVSATLGTTTNFETLQKDGAGLLTITGGGTSDYDTVLINSGQLLITAGTTVDPTTTVVASGASFTVDGSYTGTAGDDTFTTAGVVNGSGTIDMFGGDDVLTLQDGADINGIANPIDGNAHVAGDTVVTEAAGALAVDLSRLVNWEFLQKDNAGTLTLSGTGAFSGGTTITGGTLDVDGTLETPTMAMSDDTTLNVGGTVQAAGATQVAITGSAGVNTLIVDAAATLLANGSLGDGADLLDLAGTLDTGAGTFDLAAGDDTFVIHDGTTVIGTVGGGTGSDTFNPDIATLADLGAVQGFETLSKTGIGTLNINGPASSDFQLVEVLAGTLDVTAGGSVLAAPGSSLDTVVAAGATFNINGSYTASAGDDSFDLTGTVSGTGAIDLAGGDDTLTLRDGAVLANVIDGGGHGAGDTVVLDVAGTLGFDAANTINFEFLQKTNTGTATLTGSQAFAGGTTITGGTLDVDGTLETPNVAMIGGTTLNVDGTVQAAGGTPTLIAGTSGVETVSVGATGTLLATGDLGDGVDVLDVFGTLDTGAGAFALGDGDDNFIVHDGTVVLGTVDGGGGMDTRTYNINTSADIGALAGFEGITKTGIGVLNITGPGVTGLQDVQVLGGVLDVGAAASMSGVQSTVVGAGTVLNVDGSFAGSAGADTMTVVGMVSGTGTINLADGDDSFTIQDGADLVGLTSPIDGGAGTDAFVADIATDAVLGGAVGFETLTKTNIGVLNIDGPVPSMFAIVDVLGGTLNVGPAGSVAGPATGPMTTTVAAGATLSVEGSYGCGASDDMMIVSGTVSGAGTIDMCGGDDVLTLTDSAQLLTTISGGGHGAGDTVVLDITGSLTFDASNTINFEFLQKDDLGTATLVGTQGFVGGTNITGGTLDIDGTLETPIITMSDDTTLNVDGLAEDGGGTQIAIFGSVGTNTVTVGATGTLFANGSLGEGADVLDVAGTLSTAVFPFDLGAGDDTFLIHDGTTVLGTVLGGAGFDTRIYDLAGTAMVGALQEFEGLTKRGTGTLSLTDPGSELANVRVEAGTLDVQTSATVGPQRGNPLDTVILAGATFNVDGSYVASIGSDTMDVAGTVNGSGTIDLADGDDTLILRDGAMLANVVDGGGHGVGDTVVLDITGSLTFDAVNTINFEFLQKDNLGTVTLVGTQAFTGGTSITGGTLDVDGALETPVIALADDTLFNVDGMVQAAGATQATITGSAGTNSVAVGSAGLLLADGSLGDGADLLDVFGTLDTGAGVFDLGAGDDIFTVHDGTVALGTVDGGAGFDTRVYDVNLTADLGALAGFEGVTKSGAGTLNINGPGTTDLQAVQVLGGTLEIGPAGSVVATNGFSLDTLVAAGATLNVEGSYGCGASDDTMTVSGTVSGGGTIDMCGGNDTLTLTDGAQLLARISGGGHGTGDTVVLDVAGALTFDAANTINFEVLQKENSGEATLVGTQAWDAVILDAGVLTVEAGGTLETPTLSMADGTVFNINGAATGGPLPLDTIEITGSAGVNTIAVADGAMLRASGSLGDGADVLDVAGTLDTGGGVLDLGAGSDTFRIYDTTSLLGTVDGGDGIDLLNVAISLGNTASLDSLFGFESLTKDGAGALQITGTAAFVDVDLLAGLLEVTGDLTAQNTTVASGSTLQLGGNYFGTVGNDSFTVAGTVIGAGIVDLGDGDDAFTIQDGADLSGLTNPVNGGAGTDAFIADIATIATLGGAVNFETLIKTNVGTLNIDGPAPSAFTTVNLLGGTLDIGAAGRLEAVQDATVAGGASLIVDGSMLFTPGADSFVVAGVLSGSGMIDMLDGDDGLTLLDGADLSGLTMAVNGGAGSDTLTADNAAALTLDSSHIESFERLSKQNGGLLTLVGDHIYAAGTVISDGTLQIGDGGTSGTIAGDILNNAVLAFNRSDMLTYDGVISGSGTLRQIGAGTTVLTGANSYTGATQVTGGTLLVNGDQSAATGLTSVETGATLGGTGTIGGDVVIADGATLEPGMGGPGTLAINGSLALSSGSRLRYELGEANAVGSALNDLVTVGGNLTLDGTIDISAPAGGSFDIGLYRLFEYEGALINNGLVAGTLPEGSNIFVQTSVAGQVNLINTADAILNFWDGAAGPKFDDTVNGGDGIWQSGGGNDNWADVSGAVNAPYADGAIAIFTAAPGTVTVDDSVGAVAAAGLQFAVDGYRLVGDGITLVGPESTIRVGDGSANGAGYLATIDAVLSGDTRLIKTDAGTLLLGGINSYTGGTAINGGTVRIASDANLGDAAGDIRFDGGTLETTADIVSGRAVILAGAGTLSTADTTVFILDGELSGTGALTKSGSGVLVLTADSGAFGGTTTVGAGTLAVNGMLGGSTLVSNGARLEGTGQVAALSNDGIVAPGFEGAMGTLVVQGDYVGGSGRLEIAAVLGDDGSEASRLVVDGSTSGTTQVTVINRGGLGRQTAEGIKIIDVAGASDGRFVLDGDYIFEGKQAVIAGAYGYRLYQGGVSNPSDGDWYLRSALLDVPNEPQVPLYQPGVPLYETYGMNLLSLNGLPTLQQRVGNRSWAAGATSDGNGIWGRVEGTRNRANAALTTSGTDHDVDSWKIQLGMDRLLAETSQGERLVAGITAHYGKADSRVRSLFGGGMIDTDGYGIGATLTWYGVKGFYLDGQAQFSWYDSDLDSVVLGQLARGNDGRGESFSIEAGKRTPIGGKLSITPQVQMVYSNVRFDRFVDPADAAVSLDKGESLRTRWGVSIDHQSEWTGGRSHVYGLINLNYEWLDGTRTNVSGTPIDHADHRLWTEIGLGASTSWKNGVTVYGEMSGNSSVRDFGSSYVLKASAGVRVAF